jgi:hypothetical protein
VGARARSIAESCPRQQELHVQVVPQPARAGGLHWGARRASRSTMGLRFDAAYRRAPCSQ